MYDHLLDEELIIMMQNGSIEAADIFYNRYMRYAKNLSWNYYCSNRNNGIQYDDLVAIAVETAFLLLKKYSGSVQDNFYPYWRKAAETQILKFIKENIYVDANEENRINTIYFDDERNISRLAINKSSELLNAFQSDIHRLINDEKSGLDKEWYEMFILYIDGMKTKEISEMFNISPRKVRYRIQVVKEKLKNLYKRIEEKK